MTGVVSTTEGSSVGKASQSDKAERKAVRFFTLDALRGLAAILVVFDHIQPDLNLVISGHLPVDLFFGASGIVIAQNYGPRFRSGWSVFGFLKRRLIRLYPLFLLGATLGFLGALARIAVGAPHAPSLNDVVPAFLAALVMLPTRSSAWPIYSLNGPTWTMPFELLVNMLYATVFFRLRWKALLGFWIALIPFMLLASHHPLGLARGGSWGEIHIGALRALFSFSAGVVIYEAIVRHRRPTVSGAVLLPLVATPLLILYGPDPRWRPTYEAVCVMLLFPAILIIATRWNPPRLFRTPVEWLSTLSYPLYSIHYPLIFIGSYLARRAGLPTAVWAPALVFGLAALSIPLSRRFDAPARRWLAQHLGGRDKGPPADGGQVVRDRAPATLPQSPRITASAPTADRAAA